MPLPAIEFRPGTPKVQQIAEAWGRAIEAGELPAGSRLPPVRELTVQLGVSKFTVIEALDRLRARNLITSSQGRGHFVANRNTPQLPGADTDWLPQDLASVLRRSLLADNSSLRPGSGHLPADWLEEASLRQALRTVARSPRLRIAGYGAPAGYLPLRQTLQARLHGQGISAPLEQIVTTSNTVLLPGAAGNVYDLGKGAAAFDGASTLAGTGNLNIAPWPDQAPLNILSESGARICQYVGSDQSTN